MRIDKIKWKQIDNVWICPGCGVYIPKSQGKMPHIEKCKKL